MAMTGGTRPRVTFVTEQQVGLRTYSENLRRFADHDDRIEACWAPVTYVDEHGWLERMSFLPKGVIGSLRGRIQVRKAMRLPADACLFLTQTPVALGGRVARKRPYVIMVDDTPVLLDTMGEHYGLRPDKPGPIATVKRRISSIGLRRAYRVLPMSEWARRSLIDDFGVHHERAVVLATGIDLEQWTPDTTAHEAPMRILFVGGDFERKGGSVMLAAFDRLLRGTAELHVVTRSTLVAHDGVVPHYGMQPNSAELIALFRSCDVFVLPSRAEAFPNVVIEASASGLASIVTSVGAMDEMVVHGETGYVIDVDDDAELARLLQLLADDPALRSQLGAAARRRAEQCFDGRRNSAVVVDHLLAAANAAR
jgi:glycosyltransferase involved in cell wall biosynthesis